MQIREDSLAFAAVLASCTVGISGMSIEWIAVTATFLILAMHNRFRRAWDESKLTDAVWQASGKPGSAGRVKAHLWMMAHECLGAGVAVSIAYVAGRAVRSFWW